MDSKVPVKQKPSNGIGKDHSKFTTRKFLGKTEGFKDNQERHFYQRMLKAHLKGKQYFHFGFSNQFNPITKVWEYGPTRYEVLQEYS